MKDPLTLDSPWRPRHEARSLSGGAVALALMPLIGSHFHLPLPLLVEGAILVVILLLPRVSSYRRLWLRQRRLRGFKTPVMRLESLKAHLMKNPSMAFLGYGFEWEASHGGWASDFLAGGTPLPTPDTEKPGAHWIHGLSEKKEQPLHQPIAHGGGHLLIVGTTGAGKTRTFDLLITQAVLRGDAVIIIDPKGDRDLKAAASHACQLAGQPERYLFFHPAYPESSLRIDPLRNFSRPSELASRIAQIMPSQGPSDPFKAYSQKALDHVIQGMLLAGERPTLLNIRRCFDEGIADLLARALERHCQRLFGDAVRSRVPAIKGTSSETRARALIRFYQDSLKNIAPLPDLEGLMALYDHDAVHFSKMVASLLPVLNMLTAGPLGDLLSPDPRAVDDPRPMTDIARIIERRQVAYFGLDALSDSLVGSAIGAILLSDLAAVAGERYNFGTDLKPVHLFIDEAAEVINDPCIQLLNKGRGADFRITLATQTFADFSARLGSEAKARQVLANINNLIALRVLDGETQRYVVDNLPVIRRPAILRSHGATHPGHEPLSFSGNQGERLVDAETPLFPAALLGQLPDLHYIGKLAGGRMVKGRLPLLCPL